MITLRAANQRGHANHGWLDTYHTFSFADYYDPENMGFRALRVINEDKIDGGAGFPTHAHRDMEIITYIIEGELAHKDSMGNAATIKPGEVQHMSAGTGVQHSEFNPSKKNATHLLQIWILPEREGIKPSYGQKSFDEDFETKNFVLVSSKNGKDGSVPMNQNVNMYVGKFTNGDSVDYKLTASRYAWIQVVRGEIKVNGQVAKQSDGLAIEREDVLKIKSDTDSEFILFDLP